MGLLTIQSPLWHMHRSPESQVSHNWDQQHSTLLTFSARTAPPPPGGSGSRGASRRNKPLFQPQCSIRAQSSRGTGHRCLAYLISGYPDVVVLLWQALVRHHLGEVEVDHQPLSETTTTVAKDTAEEGEEGEEGGGRGGGRGEGGRRRRRERRREEGEEEGGGRERGGGQETLWWCGSLGMRPGGPT